MPKRQLNGLAWTLLGLTVVLVAANALLGLTGGVAWTGVSGFIPVMLSFALVGVLIAVRAGNRLALVILATRVLKISTLPAVGVSTLAAAALSSPRTFRYGRRAKTRGGEC